MANVAEVLFQSRNPNSTPDSLADQLGRLIWGGTDNGSSIRRELEEWIEHGDEDRAVVALAFDECTLFGSPEEMSAALDRLAVRLPQLSTNIEARQNWLRKNFSGR